MYQKDLTLKWSRQFNTLLQEKTGFKWQIKQELGIKNPVVLAISWSCEIWLISKIFL